MVYLLKMVDLSMAMLNNQMVKYRAGPPQPSPQPAFRQWALQDEGSLTARRQALALVRLGVSPRR